MTFDSRQQAGKLLGEDLLRRGISADVVIGLARGGVVVAAEVARVLQKPLDVMIVRKIGAPGNPEFAVGAVAEDTAWWDEQTVKRLGLSDEWKREQVEIKKKEVEEYRRQLDFGDSETVLSRVARDDESSSWFVFLVDDGAATGTSMLAAIEALRSIIHYPLSIIVALPVASTDAAEKFRAAAGDVVLLEEGSFLSSVGQYYRDFSQVEWEEVRQLLELNHEDHASDH